MLSGICGFLLAAGQLNVDRGLNPIFPFPIFRNKTRTRIKANEDQDQGAEKGRLCCLNNEVF